MNNKSRHVIRFSEHRKYPGLWVAKHTRHIQGVPVTAYAILEKAEDQHGLMWRYKVILSCTQQGFLLKEERQGRSGTLDREEMLHTVFAYVRQEMNKALDAVHVEEESDMVQVEDAQ